MRLLQFWYSVCNGTLRDWNSLTTIQYNAFVPLSTVLLIWVFNICYLSIVLPIFELLFIVLDDSLFCSCLRKFQCYSNVFFILYWRAWKLQWKSILPPSNCAVIWLKKTSKLRRKRLFCMMVRFNENFQSLYFYYRNT